LEVRFKSRRLERAFNREKAAVCEWGKENADRALQRYLDLRAAECLADVFLLPAARCHELKGNRKGQFAVYCRHPFRLVLVPDQDPVPRTADGGIDPAKVTKIRIIAVEDYHGR